MGSLPSVAGVLGTPWVCLERGRCVAHEGAATRPGEDRGRSGNCSGLWSGGAFLRAPVGQTLPGTQKGADCSLVNSCA